MASRVLVRRHSTGATPRPVHPLTIAEPAPTKAVVRGDGERLALCDLLDSLAPDDWLIPSLCAGWSVQDVVAHLTLATRDTTWGMIRETIKARGSFDRMTADTARAHARTFAPSELIRQLRDTADSTRRAPLSSHLDPLTDILVHGQDIARPVGRSHPISPEHVVPALSHAVASRWYGGAKRFRRVALVATDADWSAGGGQDEAHAVPPATCCWWRPAAAPASPA